MEAANKAARAAALAELQSRAPLRVLRVTQLDAEQLDEQLGAQFTGELNGALKWWRPDWYDRYRSEAQALLRMGVCAVSVWTKGATQGLALMNLKYRNERLHGLNPVGVDAPLTMTQKVLWTAGTVLIPYVWGRLARLATERQWTASTSEEPAAYWWRLLERLEGAFVVASAVNLLAFLFDGKYRSLLDRALGMRLVYERRQTSRAVSFEFLNRQLVWHAFTEFVLFLLPLVNTQKIKWTARRWLGLLPDPSTESKSCPFCDAESILVPVALVPCRHVCCYYCAASVTVSAAKERSTVECPRCGVALQGIARIVVRRDAPPTADDDSDDDDDDEKDA